jgi:deoxyribodipyrimidine photolyase-related protein
MEWYIDAYDWVMVPNVYGMSQYADGGSMVTKPYISSSNYILKMSHYKKGPWCEIWDGLFWRFMFQNRSKLKSNPRLSMLMKVWEKKSPDQQAACLNNAEDYFRQAGF